MAYSTKSDVKYRLNIDQADATDDTEIDSCIEQADAWIDAEYAKFKESVPGSVPTAVKHASADRAAGYFKERREPSEEENRFLKRAEKDLIKHLKAQYKSGVVVD